MSLSDFESLLFSNIRYNFKLSNNQITNDRTKLLTDHACRTTQNISGNCFVNCDCTLSICGNKKRATKRNKLVISQT